jgi:hypothetical protein
VKALASLLAFAIFAQTSMAHADSATPALDGRVPPPPDNSYVWANPHPYPSLAWTLTQLIPSPELAFARLRHVMPDGSVDDGVRVAFGMRWQITPVLWSFGVHRRVSPWRVLVVDPIARQSGSLELNLTPEYIAGHVDRFLVRPGLRMYLPLAHRGEYMSCSFGTSVYAYDGLRVAYDAGIYALGGFVGLLVTYAPSHDPLGAITTLQIRYF